MLTPRSLLMHATRFAPRFGEQRLRRRETVETLAWAMEEGS
jgi:hypothetical protein